MSEIEHLSSPKGKAIGEQEGSVEKELQEKLERYELAIRGSTHALWDWKLNPDRWDDPESAFWYSERLLALLNFKEGDLKNNFGTWLSLLNESDKANVLKALEAHLSQKSPFDVQCRFRNKEKKDVWFHLRGQALWTKNARAVRMAGSMVDIDARIHAENEQAVAEENYKTIFENSAVAITMTNAEEQIISWNHYTEKLLGMTYEDLHMKPIKDLYPEVEWKRMQSMNLRQLGMAHHIETKVIRKDGLLLDIDVSVTVLRTEGGGKTGSIGIFRDITERKLAESNLKSAEEKYRNIFDNCAVAITVTDSDERIISWNKFTEALLGMGAQDLRMRPVRDLYPKEEWERMQSMNLRNIGMLHQLETKILKKDGGTVDVALSVTLTKNSEGVKTGSIGIVRDITTLKEAERAMAKAKEEALAMARAKSDFLANMSHEIRTPMNGVLGMIGLLLDTTLNVEQREYAVAVHKSAESLLTVINDILDFSKIEAGKLIIEPVSFDLQMSVEEAAELLAVKAREKNVSLVVRYDPQAPRQVIGDPGRIRQVVTNLLSNAIKFTSQGHVLLNVNFEGRDGDKVKLHFAIEDSGIGISKENLGRLFQKFTQADASTTRKFGGTGLGLAICRQLVELMRGEVGVTSALGKGSVFWFKLALPVDENRVKQEVLPKVDLAKLRIMIVDDVAVNRKVLQEQLTSCRIQNDAFATGAEALAGLQIAHNQGRPYDIAILDFQLPGMDGEMLAKVIKADPRLNKTVLILLTSTGLRGDSQRFLDVGFSAYLVKPVRRDDMIGAIAKAWAARDQRDATLITRHTLKEDESDVPIEVKKEVPVDNSPISAARVLLAEDNVINQQVSKRLLEKLGCRVDIVANGLEVLNMVERLPYDIVFMDCQMPEMDGYEATRQIRKGNEKFRNIPIIALTAHATEGSRERCLEAGMNDYISKPIQRDALEAALRQWIQNKDPAQTMPSKPVAKAVDVPKPAQPDLSEKFAVINMARLKDLKEFAADEDGSFIITLFETYFTSAQPRIDKLKQAVDGKDANTMGREAHGLKGGSCNLGADRVADISRQLEELAKSGSTEGASELVSRLSVELGCVRKEFESKIRKSGA